MRSATLGKNWLDSPMPDVSLIALATLALVAVLLLVVLLRKPAEPKPDPAIPLLRDRIAALSAELAAEIAKGHDRTGRDLAASMLEQVERSNTATAKQRERLDEVEKLLIERLRRDASETQKTLTEEADKSRALLEAKLKDMREANDAKLAEIQKSVNEQLQSAVEKQMTESFNRVIAQFDAVQKSMVEVQSVTTQIGDLKRLFSNVKTRGGWGEAQCRALLEDILPGGYIENFRPREDRGDIVEFGVLMPSRSETPVYLPLDAKFPVEDYERLLLAAESGDADAERIARRAMGERVRKQASDIAQKYIAPPATLDFAVLYLPSDSLYAEVARIPGLLDEIGRIQSVLVLGPSLLPAMLRTIQLGHASFALSKNAEAVKEMLGATRTEMQKMDEVLAKLGKQAGSFGNTIERARVRTRAIGRKLRGVDAADLGRAREVLELEGEPDPSAADDEA
jgi:DNA recombination protein RmuC